MSEPASPHNGPIRFLLYGLQRTGTTFLQSLLEQNFGNIAFVNGPDRNRHSHKHFRPCGGTDAVPEPQFAHDFKITSLADLESALTPDEAPDYYLVLAKDPYSWYVSYRRWAQINRWPRPDHHYICEWNLFYGRWWEWATAEPRRVLFVRYEDLIRDGLGQLQALADRCGLSLPPDPVTRLDRVAESRTFSASRRSHYLSAGYLESLWPRELAELNAQLDRGLVDGLEYELVSRHPWADMARARRAHREMLLLCRRALARLRHARPISTDRPR